MYEISWPREDIIATHQSSGKGTTRTAQDSRLIGASLFLHVLSALILVKEFPGTQMPESWLYQSLTILGTSLIFSPFFVIFPVSRFSFSIFLGIQSVLFFVISFPLGGSILVLSLLSAILTIEFLMRVGPLWWMVFAIHGCLIGCLYLFPSRAWGLPVTRPELFDLLVAEAILAALAVALRHYVSFSHELNRKERMILSLEQSIAEVYRLNTDFFTYATEIKERSTQDERKRVSRDIHDIMGYTLVNLRVMLEVALDLVDESDKKLRPLLLDAVSHTKEGLKEARIALRTLRNIEERRELWFNRVHKLVKTFSSATRVEVVLNFGNISQSSCPKVNSAVYQFVQEGLTNSFKHGRASRVLVEFRIERTELRIRIIDNGAGSQTVVPGIGLTGMAERFEEAGGSFSYRNLVDGFEVAASLPLAAMKERQ